MVVACRVTPAYASNSGMKLVAWQFCASKGEIAALTMAYSVLVNGSTALCRYVRLPLLGYGGVVVALTFALVTASIIIVLPSRVLYLRKEVSFGRVLCQYLTRGPHEGFPLAQKC
jgi:hypothetical protein